MLWWLFDGHSDVNGLDFRLCDDVRVMLDGNVDSDSEREKIYVQLMKLLWRKVLLVVRLSRCSEYAREQKQNENRRKYLERRQNTWLIGSQCKVLSFH